MSTSESEYTYQKRLGISKLFDTSWASPFLSNSLYKFSSDWLTQHISILYRQLEFNRAFSNEAVTGVMPAGTSVCDIQTLTVWCSFADAIFAQVVVNRDLVFVSSTRFCTLLDICNHVIFSRACSVQ